MTTDPPRVDVAESQAGRIYTILKEEILTTVIRPGQFIVEPELARRYEVSRTPVREALLVLATEGWVSSLPQRGYIVRPLSFHDVREVMDLRIVLEPPLAAAAALSAGSRAVEQLRDSVTAQPAHGLSLAARLRNAEEFHLLCAAASNNHRAVTSLRPLVDEISRLHYLMPQVQAHLVSDSERDAHIAIVSAIVAEDAERSAALMRGHLTEAFAAMVDAF